MSLTEPLIQDVSRRLCEEALSGLTVECDKRFVGSDVSTIDESAKDQGMDVKKDQPEELAGDAVATGAVQDLRRLPSAALVVQSLDEHEEEDEAANQMHRAALSPIGSPRRCKQQPGLGMDDVELMTGAEATFTVVNFLMNVGLFTLPCLFARHGWFAGVIVICGGVACTYTALKLQESLVTLIRMGIPLPDYPDLAREAIGPRFALLANAVAWAEIFGYVCCNIIALANGISAIFPSLTGPKSLLVTTGLGVAMSAMTDRQYAYLALTSAGAVAALFAVVLVWGFELDSWDAPSLWLRDAASLPASFALVIFTAGTHPLLPCVMHSTRSRTEYRTSLVRAWTIFTGFTVLTGGAIFYMYGHSVRPLITDNIGRDLALHKQPGGRAMHRSGGIWVLVKLTGSLVPCTRPVISAMARQLRVQLPAGHGGWKTMALTGPLLCAIAALAWPLSDYVESFESRSNAEAVRALSAPWSPASMPCSSPV
ncbi:unnamed protein product [Effrenium voratum]|uniref:Amino acid transporter transmembrane domain-containing protein n=1 Tax=Effrenium voratum TaxID=2562239 RepID=A0AA36HPT6_9DINO|nr:unnamed protein product [Effrenium voratum]